MSTADGAIDQNLLGDFKWIFYFVQLKTVMQIKHLPSTKFSYFQHKSNNIIDTQA